MASKNYEIVSSTLSQEERFDIINEWTKKIKPIKTISPYVFIPVIVLIFLATRFLGIVFGFIVLIAFYIYIFIKKLKKPEPPKIIDKKKPSFLKIELGIVKMTYPTTIEIQNHEKGISLKYSTFGVNIPSTKGSKRIIKRWDFLTNQLQKMIEKQEHKTN